jgi:hypothetical protein
MNVHVNSQGPSRLFPRQYAVPRTTSPGRCPDLNASILAVVPHWTMARRNAMTAAAERAGGLI